MKTLTKKAIVLASAIAVAGTFAVCAAGYGTDNDGKLYPTAADKIVTVPFVTDVQGTDQITILAYCTSKTVDGVTTTYETPDANNIVFIDQVQKDTTTNDTITFSLRETDPTTATYKVLMGGTGVTTAGAGTFSVAPAGPTTFTVSGKVVDIGVEVTDPDLMAVLPYVDNSGYKINLKSADQQTILKTATVTINGTNAEYTFTDVEPGSYALQLYRIGTVVRNIPITVGNGNLTVDDKSLYVGAGVSMDSVSPFDATNLFSLIDSDVWGSTSALGQGYVVGSDFDLDGGITPFDLSAIFMNMDKDVDSYGETGVDTWDTTIE